MTHQPVEVAQGDVDAALDYLGWASYAGLHYWAKKEDIACFEQLIEAFARYRIATEQAVIDRVLSDGAVDAGILAVNFAHPFGFRAMKAAITAALNYRETKNG